MMALAVMGAMGYDLKKAQATILELRPVVEWAGVYVASVERFVKEYNQAAASK